MLRRHCARSWTRGVAIASGLWVGGTVAQPAAAHDDVSSGQLSYAEAARVPWPRASALLLVERAARAEQRGDFPSALRLYADAIQMDPSYGMGHLAYARLRERLNDFAEAERLYAIAARLPDTTQQALVDRALLRRRRGQPDEALRDLERATERAASSPHLELLASWYVERGAWPAALAVYRKLASLQEREAPAQTAVKVRALMLLSGDTDPVFAGRDSPSWVRRTLAREALVGPF